MNVFIFSLFQMSNKEREICKWVVFIQISGDTNNNSERTNAGGQTKRENERSFVYRPPAWRR